MGKKVAALRGAAVLDRSPLTNGVREQLGRITADNAFRGAPRLSHFLTFVVEATLAGRAATIKAYTIAVEAFGRGSDFDPQNDPIVRVEAGRLRAALARYYTGPGCDDPLVIELPRGTYVPVFRPAQRKTLDSPEPAEAGELPPVVDASQVSAFAQQCRETTAMLGGVRQQIRSLQAEIRATRETLNDSRSLLRAVPTPAMTIECHAEDRHRAIAADDPKSVDLKSADLESVDLESVGLESVQVDALPLASSAAEPGRNPHAGIAVIRAHMRTHARIYRRAMGVVAMLAILQVAFDIYRGPNTGLFFNLYTADIAAAQSCADWRRHPERSGTCPADCRRHAAWGENLRANVGFFLPNAVMVDPIVADFNAGRADWADQDDTQ
jgi:hypothetical protein